MRSHFHSRLALAAVLITALLLATYASLFARQMSVVRVQSNVIERTRLDGEQLLRIQADLNQTAALMRDLISDADRSIAASAPQFERIRKELDEAVTKHATFTSSPDDQTFLATPLSQFWSEAERMLTLAKDGQEVEARTLLRLSLQRQHAGLATTAAFMLLDNNEQQGQASQQLQQAMSQLRRHAVWLLAASLAMLALAAILIARVRSPKNALASPSEDNSPTTRMS